AVVESDHAAARARQRRYPARRDPVHFLVGSKTMDEHDRLALPLVEIGNLDPTVREMRHASAYSRSARLCAKAAGKRGRGQGTGCTSYGLFRGAPFFRAARRILHHS